MLRFKKNIKKKFTLTEMVVALAVFLTMMVIVLNFYDTIFNASELSKNDSMIFSNAKTALDIITRDIQCIYYQNSMTPFWHKGETISDPKKYNEELLAFISATPLPEDNNNMSKLCEVKYQLFNPDLYDPNINPDDSDSAGWIMRSVTGDNNSKWNFQYNLTADETGSLNAFTCDDSSSSSFKKLIPYVTSLSFKCYDKNGNEISTSENSTTDFPYSIQINLKLLDQSSWKKITTILKDSGLAINTTSDYAAWKIRVENEREFSKTIYLGEHGQ